MRLKRFDRPSAADIAEVAARAALDDPKAALAVDQVISDIAASGDAALRKYAAKFDGCPEDMPLLVSEEEFDEAENAVSPELKEAMAEALGNITAFHEGQLPKGDDHAETAPGVRCWRRAVPINRVGLYVPGGTAPLFSTVLMLAAPAKVAGCPGIVLSTPAKGGKVAPAVLYAARLCGVGTVVKAGGAQAIAAMALGTESVPKVDKIFGPGNRYVTLAKAKVSSFCGIDMLAGPSEVMVICDSSAKASHVALDLLSQAEHGPDSQSVLVAVGKTPGERARIMDAVEAEIEKALSRLPRGEYMLPSLSHSAAFGAEDSAEAVEIANAYAPEHLIINTLDCDGLALDVVNAGSVFLGPWSPESCGDYATGTNHTLPTMGWARFSAGVSTDSFLKKVTFQKLSRDGLGKIARTVTAMAEAEKLSAHAEAVRVRLCD